MREIQLLLDYTEMLKSILKHVITQFFSLSLFPSQVNNFKRKAEQSG